MDQATDSFIRWACVAAAVQFAGCHCTQASSNYPDGGTIPDGGIPDARIDGGFVVETSILQHHFHPSRDGAYVEPAFTRSAAAGMHLDPGFNARIQGATYAQPLYLDRSPGGRDRLIVATEQNNVYLLDATTGAVIAQTNVGAAARLSQLPCGIIDPLGVTGTPIVDPVTQSVFLDAMTIPNGSSTPTHLVLSLSVDDLSTRAGWPVDISARIRVPVPFDSAVQNQRGALALLNGTLYVPYGGHYGDCGTYHGWVVGIPTTNPTSVTGWSTRAVAGGVWAPGGIASDGFSLFIATGNTFDATVWGDGEGIIRLSPGPMFAEQSTDFFRPTDWLTLDQQDLDLGGSGPILVNVSGSNPSRLIVALGKNGSAYLLDPSNLGGESAGGIFSAQVSSSPIINAAATYTTAQGTYVVFRGSGTDCPNGLSGDLIAIRISGPPPSFQTIWCATQGGRGSPIATTTDGRANAIVWSIGAAGDGRLHGFDGDTGQVVFGGGGPPESMPNVPPFQTPIVAKGRIFIAGRDRVYALSP